MGTGGIMVTEGREIDFMDCCFAMPRKHMNSSSYCYGKSRDLKSFPEVKENEKIENND